MPEANAGWENACCHRRGSLSKRFRCRNQSNNRLQNRAWIPNVATGDHGRDRRCAGIACKCPTTAGSIDYATVLCHQCRGPAAHLSANFTTATASRS